MANEDKLAYVVVFYGSGRPFHSYETESNIRRCFQTTDNKDAIDELAIHSLPGDFFKPDDFTYIFKRQP